MALRRKRNRAQRDEEVITEEIQIGARGLLQKANQANTEDRERAVVCLANVFESNAKLTRQMAEEDNQEFVQTILARLEDKCASIRHIMTGALQQVLRVHPDLLEPFLENKLAETVARSVRTNIKRLEKQSTQRVLEETLGLCTFLADSSDAFAPLVEPLADLIFNGEVLPSLQAAAASTLFALSQSAEFSEGVLDKMDSALAGEHGVTFAGILFNCRKALALTPQWWETVAKPLKFIPCMELQKLGAALCTADQRKLGTAPAIEVWSAEAVRGLTALEILASVIEEDLEVTADLEADLLAHIPSLLLLKDLTKETTGDIQMCILHAGLVFRVCASIQHTQHAVAFEAADVLLSLLPRRSLKDAVAECLEHCMLFISSATELQEGHKDLLRKVLELECSNESIEAAKINVAEIMASVWSHQEPDASFFPTLLAGIKTSPLEVGAALLDCLCQSFQKEEHMKNLLQFNAVEELKGLGIFDVEELEPEIAEVRDSLQAFTTQLEALS